MNAHHSPATITTATAAASVAEVDGFTIVGPDGTPVLEVPAVTVDRMARLADEVAALVNQVAAALTWQVEALTAVTATTPLGQSHLDAARTVAARSATSLLNVVLGAIGEVYVTCDQLAHDLRTARGDTR